MLRLELVNYRNHLDVGADARWIDALRSME